MEFRGLRDDVYRRPLATALDRLGIGPGWTCVDVGAGGGDVSVALAEIVGRDGRVYSVDSDPGARDEVADAAAAHSQVLAITQAGGWKSPRMPLQYAEKINVGRSGMARAAEKTGRDSITE